MVENTVIELIDTWIQIERKSLEYLGEYISTKSHGDDIMGLITAAECLKERARTLNSLKDTRQMVQKGKASGLVRIIEWAISENKESIKGSYSKFLRETYVLRGTEVEFNDIESLNNILEMNVRDS